MNREPAKSLSERVREFDWTPAPSGAKRDPVPVSLDERKSRPADGR